MNEHGRNDRDILRYTDVEYTPEGYENVYRWDDFLEIAGGDARYAAMLINRTVAGEPEEGLHPETLVDQDIRDGEAFMLAGRPIVPEDVDDLPRTVHGLYSELVDNVGRSGTLLRDWRGFSAGADADDVLREIEGAFGDTEDSRAGTVLGAYADDTFMSPIYAAEDAARDVTPLTPWEDEDGVAFLSRTLDADASAIVGPGPLGFRGLFGSGSRASRSGNVGRRRERGRYGRVLSVYSGDRVGPVSPVCSRKDFAMDFFMPAERVLYDRSYFFSDEALEEYTAEVADRDLVDIDEVASSAELMDEVRWEIDKAIDRDLLDEICNFDSMLQELKRGDDPEHPTEISVVAKGTVERWDIPWIVREQEIDFPAVAALVAAKHGDYLCPVPLSSMIAVGMQRAHVCYADGSFTGQMQRFLSPAILNRTHDFDNHCDALNAIVEKCFDRVAFSLGISDQVERARRKLATEISSGSISSAVLPKRTLGLS